MKAMYDRLEAGERLRMKRILLGMTQDEVAEKINRAAKYYADIERGNCGMSLETLLALSKVLNMSLDHIVLGKNEENQNTIQSDEVTAVLNLLETCDSKRRDYALRLLKLFLAACDSNV